MIVDENSRWNFTYNILEVNENFLNVYTIITNNDCSII